LPGTSQQKEVFMGNHQQVGCLIWWMGGQKKKPLRFTKPWKMTRIKAIRSEQNLETLQLNDSLVFPLTIGHFEGM